MKNNRKISILKLKDMFSRKKENKLEIKNIIIIVISIIIMLILILIGGYSLAKTTEEIILKNQTQIAEPILTIENSKEEEINEMKNSALYKFKVKNYNAEDKITDIDLKYYIELLYNNNDAINVEIYQNNENIELENNKTKYITIEKGDKKENIYEIRIEYDKDKVTEIADIIEKIQIKIHAEQA